MVAISIYISCNQYGYVNPFTYIAKICYVYLLMYDGTFAKNFKSGI